MDLALRVALAHAGKRVEVDAAELEAHLEVPGLAAALLEVLVRSVGVGGSKTLPGSPVTLNAFQDHSGIRKGLTSIAGGESTTAPDDDVDKLCNHLADALDDRHSLAWYRQVVRLVPRELVLERVVELGTATAADLSSNAQQIGLTAWSNRLAALFDLRLVRKRKDGRRLHYAPAWKE
ncbi:MAG: hypothetical protein ABIO72_03070 [Patescibacteria group bacterium]